MTDEARCKHHTTNVKANLVHLEDNPGLHYLELSATCGQCGEEYHFVGFSMGLSPGEPRANVDETELRLPCRLTSDPDPRPSAGFDVKCVQ